MKDGHIEEGPEHEKIILKEGHFLRFVRKGSWEYFERNNCTDIVIILAMTVDYKVLFVEQYRPPLDCCVIEFPAGLVNDHHLNAHPDEGPRETVLTAAKRELLEETGYEAQEIVELLKGPVSGGATSDLVTMVQAKHIKKVMEAKGDGTESIVLHEIPLSEVDAWLKTMALQGLLVEPKIYTGLYFLRGCASI